MAVSAMNESTDCFFVEIFVRTEGCGSHFISL